jgi:5-(carboxyamino)imidazole ribonucleotide mutase
LDGALNAGILAAQILGTSNAAIADKLEKYKVSLKDKVMRSVEELRRGDRDLD